MLLEARHDQMQTRTFPFEQGRGRDKLCGIKLCPEGTPTRGGWWVVSGVRRRGVEGFAIFPHLGTNVGEKGVFRISQCGDVQGS